MNKDQAKKKIEEESLLRQQTKTNIKQKRVPVSDNRYMPSQRTDEQNKDISYTLNDSLESELYEERHIINEHVKKPQKKDVNRTQKYDTVNVIKTKRSKYEDDDKRIKKTRFDTKKTDTLTTNEDKPSVIIGKDKKERFTDSELRQKAYFVSRLDDKKEVDKPEISPDDRIVLNRQRIIRSARKRTVKNMPVLSSSKYHANRMYDPDQNKYDNSEISKDINISSVKFAVTAGSLSKEVLKDKSINKSKFKPVKKTKPKQTVLQADLVNEQKRAFKRFRQRRDETIKSPMKISLKERLFSKIKRIAKRNTTGVIIAAVCLIFIISLLSSAGIVLEGVSEAAGVYLSGLSLSTDLNMTRCEEYFKELEANLCDVIENLEEYYPGFDRYVIDFDDEIGHDAIKLMAYLSAMYDDYDLSSIKGVLDSLFDEMYVVEFIEEKETQDDEEINILTLKITKTDWDTLMAGRISEDKNRLYESYERSEGGHQAFLSPFEIDWSDRITSGFGLRIHPISGVERFHKGIDIGMPEGTPVLSCSKGVVIKSTYTETEGNYVVVLDETGYKCHYMHLSERNVSEGDMVTHESIIGKVGSTGYSTGPHLHLQITDENNECLNPEFLVQKGN